MGYICDHCEEPLHVNSEGNFVGRDNTAECAESDGGHEWDGRTGL